MSCVAHLFAQEKVWLQVGAVPGATGTGISLVRCLRNGLWGVWWLHCSLSGLCWWRVCSKELPGTSCTSWQVPQVYLTVCDVGILMFAQMGLILHRCVHACLKWTQSFWLWKKVSNRHFPGRYSCLNWHINGIDMIVILWVQGKKSPFHISAWLFYSRGSSLVAATSMSLVGHLGVHQLTMEGTAGQCPWDCSLWSSLPGGIPWAAPEFSLQVQQSSENTAQLLLVSG